MRDLIEFAGGSLGLWLVMMGLAAGTLMLEALWLRIRRRGKGRASR